MKYLFKYCCPFEMGRIDNIINDFYISALSLWTVTSPDCLLEMQIPRLFEKGLGPKNLS